MDGLKSALRQAGFEIVKESPAQENWAFGGATLIVPFLPEVNGYVAVDVVNTPYHSSVEAVVRCNTGREIDAQNAIPAFPGIVSDLMLEATELELSYGGCYLRQYGPLGCMEVDEAYGISNAISMEELLFFAIPKPDSIGACLAEFLKGTHKNQLELLSGNFLKSISLGDKHRASPDDMIIAELL